MMSWIEQRLITFLIYVCSSIFFYPLFLIRVIHILLLLVSLKWHHQLSLHVCTHCKILEMISINNFNKFCFRGHLIQKTLCLNAGWLQSPLTCQHNRTVSYSSKLAPEAFLRSVALGVHVKLVHLSLSLCDNDGAVSLTFQGQRSWDSFRSLGHALATLLGNQWYYSNMHDSSDIVIITPKNLTI